MHRTHGGNLQVLAPTYGFQIKETLDFSANLNPYGPPSLARVQLQAALENIAYYPDWEYKKLRSALSEWEGVGVSNVVAANGASELIAWIPVLVQTPKALMVGPTFTEYEQAVHSKNGGVQYALALEGDGFRYPFVIKEEKCGEYNLVFFANPNNPTGNFYSNELLGYWMERWWSKNPETIFVSDESFLPFLGEGKKFSLNSFAAKKERVIVLHSLTKILSIPGLRLGYAVAHSKTLCMLEKILPAWRVNCLAEKIGESVLEYSDFMVNSAKFIQHDREELARQLEDFTEFKVFASAANFILVKCSPEISAAHLTENLAKRGIFVRLCNDFKGLEEDRFIRVAVRIKKENEILVAALREFSTHGG